MPKLKLCLLEIDMDNDQHRQENGHKNMVKIGGFDLFASGHDVFIQA